MRFAVPDIYFWDLPLESRLKKIADLGFDGVELCLVLAELGYDVLSYWPKNHSPRRMNLTPLELSRVMNDSGLEIQSFSHTYVLGPEHGYGLPTPVLDGSALRERIGKIKKIMDFVSGTGGERILIIESGGDPEKTEQWDKLIDAVRILVDYAETLGITLAIENAPHVLVHDEDDLSRLMREVNSKNLGINFDPANLNMCPPGKRDVPQCIRKLAGHIVSVHVKDSVYGGGKYGKTSDGKWNCPPLGQGTTVWKECVKAFKDVGYSGFWTMEFFASNFDVQEATRGVLHNRETLRKYFDETH